MNFKHKNELYAFITRAGEPEPEPLEKKTGAGAAWKKSQDP